MASPTGLAAQFGYKSESVVGTGVTVDTFLPFDSEAIRTTYERLVSSGLRAGRRTRSVWKTGRKPTAGPVEMDLWNLDVAALGKHMFGNVVTTGTGPYTHTFTPADLFGKSLTVQVGRPDLSGTVRAFTFAGCKINTWRISAAVGEIAKLGLDLVAMSETTATALATATYDSNLEPFVFTEASLTVGGSALVVKSLELTGDNKLAERFRLGSGVSKEYIQSDFAEFGGSLVCDFEDLTEYNLIVNGTETALVATYDNGTESLVVTCNVRFDGDGPEVRGPEMLELPMNFMCTSTTSDAAAITAVLINGESSAA